MILDRLDNLRQYGNLPYGIPAAIDYLLKTDFSRVADGRHELDGERLVAIVMRYRTRPLSEIVWEAHRRYADVQCMIEGQEQMGHLLLNEGIAVNKPYNPDTDAIFFDAQGVFFPVRTGEAAIFLPHDIHAPCLAFDNQPAEARKVCVKCLVT